MKYEGMMIKETATNILANSPEAIYEVFKDSGKLAQETFSIATLNAKNKIIGEHLISVGTVSSTVVHPREVFKAAILDGATSIILSHNHPSGDVTPSLDDINITKQLVDAGKIMGIRVLDHVIIGDREVSSDGFLSLRETAIVTF